MKLRALAMAGLLLAGLSVGMPRPAEAAVWVTGRVVEVLDGAHVVAWVNGERRVVRLAGVDIDPLSEDERLRARDYLASEVLGRDVRFDIESWELEPGGYLPAYVYLNDDFINVTLVNAGFVRVGFFGPFWGYRDRFWAAERYAYDRHLAAWDHHREWRAHEAAAIRHDIRRDQAIRHDIRHREAVAAHRDFRGGGGGPVVRHDQRVIRNDQRVIRNDQRVIRHDQQREFHQQHINNNPGHQGGGGGWNGNRGNWNGNRGNNDNRGNGGGNNGNHGGGEHHGGGGGGHHGGGHHH